MKSKMCFPFQLQPVVKVRLFLPFRASLVLLSLFLVLSDACGMHYQESRSLFLPSMMYLAAYLEYGSCPA